MKVVRDFKQSFSSASLVVIVCGDFVRQYIVLSDRAILDRTGIHNTRVQFLQFKMTDRR